MSVKGPTGQESQQLRALSKDEGPLGAGQTTCSPRLTGASPPHTGPSAGAPSFHPPAVRLAAKRSPGCEQGLHGSLPLTARTALSPHHSSLHGRLALSQRLSV